MRARSTPNVLQHAFCCSTLGVKRAVTPPVTSVANNWALESTHETASPQTEHQAYTKPARMPKPMHAHTKHERPTAKRSAATNDTSLTNDQRNTLDHAMPVRAPYTHTSTPRAVPCAFAFAMPRYHKALHCVLSYIVSCAGKPNLRCEPNLRRLADLICQADL